MADIYNMSDVFISYSRRDEAFVRRIFGDLKALEKEVWADFEDIPKAADWWAEIKAGINAADTFVFVISPDSVKSTVCRDEIEQAVAAKKRFIPILHREITEAEDKEKVHPAINSHNWIFFRESDDYDTAFKTLVTSIETDLDHNRVMTRLLVRAQEWQNSNHSASFLLNGEDLTDAETWLQGAISKEPSPTDLHVEYISASRKAETNRQRRLLTFVSVGFVLAIILSFFAVWQAVDARQARDQAEAARVQAETEAIRAQSLSLASSSGGALFNNDPDLALVLAMEAAELDATSPQVFSSLANAVYSNGTQRLLDVGNEFLYSVAISIGGDVIAHGSNAGSLCLHSISRDEALLCLEGHQRRVTHLAFTDDGRQLLSTGADGTLRWWDVDPNSPTYGDMLGMTTHFDENGEPNFVASAVLHNLNGIWYVYFGGSDGAVGRWLPTEFDTPDYWDSPHTSPVQAMTINERGTRLLTGDQDSLMAHWYIPYESIIDAYEVGDTSITALAFNTLGDEVLVGFFNGLIQRIDLLTTTITNAYNRHEDSIRSLVFGERDETFISISWDTSILEWDAASERVIRTFHGHQGGINDVAIDPSTERMVTAGFDTDVRVWSLASFRDRRLTSSDGIWHAELSPDGDTLLTSHANGDVILHDWRTEEIRVNFKGYGVDAIWATFSPDGRYIATIFRDHYLTLRDIETGKRLWVAELSELVGSISRPFQVHFTPDGERVVAVLPNILYIADALTGEVLDQWDFGDEMLLSARILPDNDRIVLGINRAVENLILYDLNTRQEIRQFTGHQDGILSINFSRDGRYMVTGSFDNSVRVWELETGMPVRAFSGHSNSINDVAFNADASVVASVSSDRSVRLWSMESGFEFFRYVGHASRVNAIAYTPNFDRFITGSADDTYIVWELPETPDELLVWVRDNRYVRQLACSEALLYLNSDCDPLAEG